MNLGFLLPLSWERPRRRRSACSTPDSGRSPGTGAWVLGRAARRGRRPTWPSPWWWSLAWCSCPAATDRFCFSQTAANVNELLDPPAAGANKIRVIVMFLKNSKIFFENTKKQNLFVLSSHAKLIIIILTLKSWTHVTRVAPDWNLWRTLYQLSYSAAACSQEHEGQCAQRK